jgi:hypothetical protein
VKLVPQSSFARLVVVPSVISEPTPSDPVSLPVKRMSGLSFHAAPALTP